MRSERRVDFCSAQQVLILMEEGKWSDTQTGSPQGSVISPLLANIYLHYSFDLWVDVWRRKWAQGDVVVVRYADDIILGFQHQTEADRFLGELSGTARKVWAGAPSRQEARDVLPDLFGSV
jgi:Reverse transcriptase (RNA-dependent DNA polymerase)